MKKLLLSISIVLAAAISLPAQAQLGGALKKAANAAKKVEKAAEKTSAATEAAAEATTETTTTTGGGATTASPVQSPAGSATRKAPIVWPFTGDGSDIQMFAFNIGKQSPDSIKNLKAQIEARHAENLAINDATAKKEIELYGDLMEHCKRQTQNFAKIDIEGDKVSVYRIECRLYTVQFKGQDPVFHKEGIVTPMPDDEWNTQLYFYSNLMLLMRQEPPAQQFPEYQKAQVTHQYIFMAQKNSLGMQEKLPVPKDGMNNPTLAAQMLKLAQAKYPDMGIVKVVIRDADWTIERDALGQPLRKRIGTYIIRKSGDGYLMTDHSFAQPYEGGSYGSTIHYAVGLQNFAVDYK